jgi:hypothetical protein
MIVAFRASVPVKMTDRRPLLASDLWADQPTPPPPIADRYDDPERPWLTWPPRRSTDETPQQLRIQRTLFMMDRNVTRLDEYRCRFTYTRCTLVGTLDLDPETVRVWTTDGWSQVNAATALNAVLLLLRCALSQCYEVRPPSGLSISGILLPDLTISLREVPRGRPR